MNVMTKDTVHSDLVTFDHRLHGKDALYNIGSINDTSLI